MVVAVVAVVRARRRGSEVRIFGGGGEVVGWAR
jgi:hypothetical protein